MLHGKGSRDPAPPSMLLSDFSHLAPSEIRWLLMVSKFFVGYGDFKGLRLDEDEEECLCILARCFK